MWPKMLIELLPHLTRLVPMWEKFFSAKAANDKATESALATMAAASAGVRQDLGEMTAAHASLYRQMQEQSASTRAQIAGLARAIDETREATERLDVAVRQAQAGVASLGMWVKGGVVTIVLLLVALLALVGLHRAG